MFYSILRCVARMARLVTRNWMAVMIAFGGCSFEHGTALKGANTLKSDGAAEYCAGYTDKHGQWNNGFFCPRWGRPDQVYCCGPEDHRYCCSAQGDDESANSGDNRLQVPLLAGLTVAVVLTLTLMSVALCYCCPCCVVYRRRKTRFADRSANSIVDWHVTSANPVRCEISAPIPRPVDTIIINPPPYDVKDAPPNYSSICKIKGPCPAYSSESAFRPYQGPAARGVQDEAKQHGGRVVSPRLAALFQYQKPPQGVAQHRRTSDHHHHQQQQHQQQQQQLSTVRCTTKGGTAIPTNDQQRENEKFVRVALSFKPLNTTEVTPFSRKTEGHGTEHSFVGLEDGGHQMSSYELLPLTSNAFNE